MTISGHVCMTKNNKIVDKLKSINGGMTTSIEGKKIFASAKNSLSEQSFFVGNNEYFLATRPDNVYEVRRLSSTNGRNVIFSISLKEEQDPSDLTMFESEMKPLAAAVFR